GVGQRRGARAVRLADTAQTLLWSPPRVVRADGRALFRHVVGAGRTSAHGRGGHRTAAALAAAWAERACVRLGQRPFRATMGDGGLGLRAGVRTTPLSDRFWRSVTLLVGLDLAAGIAITAGLVFWLMWH